MTNKAVAIDKGGEESKLLVDQAFQDLYGFPWGTTFQLQPKEGCAEDPTTQLLIRMLGRTSAARILRYSNHVTTGKRSDQGIPSSSSAGAKRSAISRPSTTAAATKPTVHKKAQHVKQQSPQKPQQTNAKPPPVASTKPAGVDQLLQQLEGSGKVSTIAKTSSDWEQFKEKSGLGERLEEQAESNTSYLQKQDFLSRVDNRTFEVERKEREQNRGK